MYISRQQKLLIKYVFLLVFLAVVAGSVNTVKELWDSVYVDENQSIEEYNSIKMDVLNNIERGYKSISPPAKSHLKSIRLYIAKKSQKALLSNLPYSRKEWVRGVMLENNKLIKIKAKHRGDNPNNWLHKKKSWRIKRKKSNLLNGVRVFNYVIPRDSTLINAYLGYYVAKKMGIPTPNVQFVDLYINDKLQGIYLEIESIDENFLRQNRTMPVNMYKGSPSRTDKPLYLDTDLFNNPYLWKKTSVFNARDKSDISDLTGFLSLIRDAVNDSKKMSKLEEVADIKKWAKFSAYETIMQTWHNYEKNNMHLISDSWLGTVYPLSYDSVFNDTKSDFQVDEVVILDNAAHALAELYTNHSKFLYYKYKVIQEMLENDLYSDLRNETKRIFNKIKNSWDADPSHVQFVLSNNLNARLYTSKGVEEENIKLISRINYIENKIKKSLQEGYSYKWNQKKSVLNIMVESRQPVTQLQICSKTKVKYIRLSTNTEDSDKTVEFKSSARIDGCSQFDLILNSNRVRPIANISRATTFFANSQFDIKPTIFSFNLPKSVILNNVHVVGMNTKEITAKYDDQFIASTMRKYNQPFSLNIVKKKLVWNGVKHIKNTMVIDNPVLIKKGTVIKLGNKASLIFKNRVNMEGSADNKIRFIRAGKKPWGILAIVGEAANSSILSNVIMDGGSGGYYGGMYFTGMFSIYNTKDIELVNIHFTNNFQYDDLVHVLYSNNISFSNCKMSQSRSDALDIDISQVSIRDCSFVNSGNDSIDSMTSNVDINNTVISVSGDKGISAGEASVVHVSNTKIENTKIAIQSKDRSVVDVENTTFLENETQLNAYKKNWRYNSGGVINVQDSIFRASNNSITAKNKSRITVKNSIFNNEFTGKQGKKILLIDNRIEP